MWLVMLIGCAKEVEDSGPKPDPVAEIEVDPLALAFGEVVVAGAPAALDFRVQNVGDLDLTLTAIRVGCLGPYTVSPSDGVVVPGGTLHATVLYDPTEVGEDIEVVEVLSLDADEPVVQVALSGIGV